MPRAGRTQCGRYSGRIHVDCPRTGTGGVGSFVSDHLPVRSNGRLHQCFHPGGTGGRGVEHEEPSRQPATAGMQARQCSFRSGRHKAVLQEPGSKRHVRAAAQDDHGDTNGCGIRGKLHKHQADQTSEVEGVAGNRNLPRGRRQSQGNACQSGRAELRVLWKQPDVGRNRGQTKAQPDTGCSWTAGTWFRNAGQGTAFTVSRGRGATSGIAGTSSRGRGPGRLQEYRRRNPGSGRRRTIPTMLL